MKVTYHLAKRFLQRVLHKEPSNQEIHKIYVWLNNVLKNLEVKSISGYVVMPGFEDFVLAYENGVFTTILKKEWVKKELLYKSGKLSKREFLKSRVL